MRLAATVLLLLAVDGLALSAPANETKAWSVGTPIVTYYAGPGYHPSGPPMSDAAARQMADGGFNVVWCSENELDLVQRHGLRAQLRDGLLSPATLDDPAQREKLDALIDRVRRHPALYCYYITDEPGAAKFPALGKLVAYLRQRDPARMAYINLFPTYANNEQLGNQGDTVTAYREHLRQYVKIVEPDLISYDHYQFTSNGDTGGYFLNLAMIRRAALDANLPFLNIVQACSWTPAMRVPNAEEMRYLVYTTLAYGAQGISYYVYCWPGHTGGIALADGTPTPIYHALETLNREFVTIAEEVQPLASLAAYHAGMTPEGAESLPENAPFRFDPPLPAQDVKARERCRGALLGYFGKPDRPSHVVVVNLDYKGESAFTLVAPGNLEIFDATSRAWSSTGGARAELRLPGGGGKLLRLAP
ncbi:MAG: hypothetical protein GXY83_04350 [Rhodopirellula sp.]|mgnify:CR=1 FL=1|nr:hypothetical protein [Rhodopirellula sp.]